MTIGIGEQPRVGSSACRGAPLYLDPQGRKRNSYCPKLRKPFGYYYVRIIGYVIDPSNSIIYFDPDKSWLEI